jgi:hypothetical protein
MLPIATAQMGSTTQSAPSAGALPRRATRTMTDNGAAVATPSRAARHHDVTHRAPRPTIAPPNTPPATSAVATAGSVVPRRVVTRPSVTAHATHARSASATPM